ncbi:amino acid transporter [uncultured Corynebacterium sp.]|uniref:amino acid transporter n=1 Tax=uncultured Corynebacterium sp. TaxID=159447 RepID=UPI0025D6DFC8|nr:amino acid transporter [uncultured Corynebacterium sp.]
MKSQWTVHLLRGPVVPRDVRRDHFSTTATQRPASTYPWWRVMCLSGVDYFSTIGYQPGLAVLAAGALAPLATLVLVAVTLLGVVPVYRAVAVHSPHGMGSISLAERLLSGWKGKFAVLVLLGFAMTDFVITMMLSAADASAHLLGTSSSPWQMWVTLGLLALLAGVFLRGFSEAVAVAGVLVTVYLGLTVAVLVASAIDISQHLELIGQWRDALTLRSSNPAMLVALALLVFPKLALGLSGFEAGVSVMPLVKSDGLPQRIERSKKLLLASALIMSALLMTSSFAVTLLIPSAELDAGGAANGRAVAWLAARELGPVFGTAYDWATVAILWFAGASAMSGLLALIPRYLPRYGMAPDWAKRSRPMVLVLTAVAALVTVVFHADVDRQAGAYATGVLVATFVANSVERPDGLHVAGWFILAIVVASLSSRVWRAFDLREVGVTADETAMRIIETHCLGPDIVLVPAAQHADMGEKERRIRQRNSLDDEPIIFIEIELRDPSQYEQPLNIRGCAQDGVPILKVEASSIPNAVAIVALKVKALTGKVPDIYFEWSPGNPLKEMLRFIFLGDGQNATVTREILRRALPDDDERPRIHLC